MHPFFPRPSRAGIVAFVAAFIPSLLMALYMPYAWPVARSDILPEIQLLVKQGQFPQALAKADAYLSAHPKEAAVRFLKGVILTEMERPTDAIAVFSKLTEDFPALPEPYNNLAVLYAQQKQYDKARVALEMAIKTHPSYSVAHENLGDIYARLASQSYDRALQRDSSHTVAPSQLALIRDLGNSTGKPELARLDHPANSAQVVSGPTPETPKSAISPFAAQETAQKSSEVSLTQGTQGHPLPLESSAGDADVAKILQHWGGAWSHMDFKTAIGYFISDLTCRIMREKISSSGLISGTVSGSPGSSGASGCRSELRKSRFW